MNKKTVIVTVLVVVLIVLIVNKETVITTARELTGTQTPGIVKTAADGYNNPGNIRQGSVRFIGEITQPFEYGGMLIAPLENRFKAFTSMAYGYRAMIKILRTYVKRGQNTLVKIINTYAPASDGNNPATYIEYVKTRAGIADENADISAIINGPGVMEIVRHMAQLEQGSRFSVNNEDLRTAYNLA